MKSMVFAVLTLLAGTGALFVGCSVSSEVRAKKGWPTTDGKIVERGVGAPMHTSGRSFLPRAVYTYTVGGKSYKNDQVYLVKGTGGTSDDMKALVDGLPDPVPVHYDEDNPAESYLVTNSMSTFYIALAIGILLLIIGGLQLAVVATKSS